MRKAAFLAKSRQLRNHRNRSLLVVHLFHFGWALCRWSDSWVRSLHSEWWKKNQRFFVLYPSLIQWLITELQGIIIFSQWRQNVFHAHSCSSLEWKTTGVSNSPNTLDSVKVIIETHTEEVLLHCIEILLAINIKFSIEKSPKPRLLYYSKIVFVSTPSVTKVWLKRQRGRHSLKHFS